MFNCVTWIIVSFTLSFSFIYLHTSIRQIFFEKLSNINSYSRSSRYFYYVFMTVNLTLQRSIKQYLNMHFKKWKIHTRLLATSNHYNLCTLYFYRLTTNKGGSHRVYIRRNTSRRTRLLRWTSSISGLSGGCIRRWIDVGGTAPGPSPQPFHNGGSGTSALVISQYGLCVTTNFLTRDVPVFGDVSCRKQYVCMYMYVHIMCTLFWKLLKSFISRWEIFNGLNSNEFEYIFMLVQSANLTIIIRISR